MSNVIPKKLLLFTAILVVVQIGLLAQSNNILAKVNIASPNAAAIAKYGDIPVNYHTGIPNVSIPIYSIKEGSISLPIDLSYHAGGLRVDEVASWVGAGWSLNVGGVITRTVKGLPDERQTGNLNQACGYYSDYGYYSNLFKCEACGFPTEQVESTEGVRALMEGKIDGEPDLFNFNFNGYSGKFYFNDDRTPMLVPEQGLKIEPVYTPGIWSNSSTNPWRNSPGAWVFWGRCIESFKITTPDGTQYFFGMQESQPPSPYTTAIEVVSTLTLFDGTLNTTGVDYSQVISSWYLYKIVSADKNFTIDLYYERDKFATFAFTSKGAPFCSYYPVKTFNAGVKLSKIESKNTIINFVPGNARKDLSRWASGTDLNMSDAENNTSTSLGAIKICTRDNVPYKRFNFSYSYLEAASNQPALPGGYQFFTDKKKLKLDKIQEFSGDESMSLPPYLFEYFQEPIARGLSFSKDYWGYNNGITTNTVLMPLITGINGPVNQSSYADRSSHWPAMRAGSLQKIIYPTGGNTEFEFEPNAVAVNKNINGTPTLDNEIIGGLRIKKIMNQDHLTGNVRTINYAYDDESSGLSKGILYGKPVYVAIQKNDHAKMTNGLGTGCTSGCISGGNCTSGAVTSFLPTIYSDNPVRPMENTQGYHVGYSEVKVYEEGNGYSKYRYATLQPWQLNYDGVAVTKIANSSCDPSLPNMPAAPPATDFYRGLLKYEGQYNNDGRIVSEKEYTTVFTDNPVTTPGIIFQPMLLAGGNSVRTLYNLSTARKTFYKVIERTFSQGESIMNETSTFYESPYHYEPTRIVTVDSKGKTIEKKIKYSFDYRSPVFENTPTCNLMPYIIATDAWYSGGYAGDMASCGENNTGMALAGCTQVIYDAYWKNIKNARLNYIECRKINYLNTSPLNTYQSNHDFVKNNANDQLKSVLWMQDNFINTPIEITEWKDGKLIDAVYHQYKQDDVNTAVTYPIETDKIDINEISELTHSYISGDSIIKDPRYSKLASYLYNNGNIQKVASRDGLSTIYQWSDNGVFPIAKIVAPEVNGNQTFYFNDFENESGSNIETGEGHSGKKFWNSSSYSLSPGITDNNNFLVQWWSFENGKWEFHEAPYTNNMTLNGPLDDIRIFQLNAQPTTYVYQPNGLISSVTQPNGKSAYYDYDPLMRLQYIKDNERNIVKKMEYQYAGGTNTITYFNDAKSVTLMPQNCQAGYTPYPYTYTVAEGVYTSTISKEDANQLADNDVAANAQNAANASGNCFHATAITGVVQFNCALSPLSSSGQIVGFPGSVIKVKLHSGGATANSYTMSIHVYGSGIDLNKSVTNGETSFEFFMPASGSVQWEGGLTCLSGSSNTGGGNITVE